MVLSLANNISSLQAQHNLLRSSNKLAKSLERLSSGFKINRAADGPAGLVISEQQRAQIVGLQTAIDNASKGVSMIQTAEGAFTEINSLLLRIRALALDSANAAVNDSDALAANQAEVSNALDTIDRIANNTQFGTKKLLDGSAGFLATTTNGQISSVKATSKTKVGTYDIDVTTVAAKGAVTVDNGSGTLLDNDTVLAVNETLTITPAGGSAVQIVLTGGMTNAQVRDAINEKTSETGVVASLDGGSGALRLATTQFGKDFSVQSNVSSATAGSTGIGTTLINTATSSSGGGLTIQDGDHVIANVTNGGDSSTGVVGVGDTITFASGAFEGLSITFAATADGLNTQALTNGIVNVTDNSLVFQIGPNDGQTASTVIDKSSSDALGTGVANVSFASLKQIDVTTASGAQDAIKVIDKAIDEISGLRGRLGAFQAQTLESTANNLRATLENTVAAESVIRDTDFAAEVAVFTQQQVLVQAGTTVLSNANALSQLVLGLLQ